MKKLSSTTNFVTIKDTKRELVAFGLEVAKEGHTYIE